MKHTTALRLVVFVLLALSVSTVSIDAEIKVVEGFDEIREVYAKEATPEQTRSVAQVFEDMKGLLKESRVLPLKQAKSNYT
jgi:hypothetical protein